MTQDESHGIVRRAALIATLAGAAGSFGLMLAVGHRQRSPILIVLFTVWDLSPFAALVYAGVVSRSWSVLTRSVLYGVMLLVTLGSVGIYGYVALGPPRPQPAFLFLVVPLVSWLLIGIIFPLAAFLSGRRSGAGR